MNRKVPSILCITFLCLGLILTGKIFADPITFTALDGGANLILNGYTSPLSLITFTEDNIVIGTTSSDNKGWFEKEFTTPKEGNHLISIHSTSPKNEMTPSIQKDYTLIPLQATELENIILPPAIDINKTTFNPEDSVIISGYTQPAVSLALVLTGAKPVGADFNSDENGYYTYTLNAKDLTPGSYKAQTFTKDSSDQIIGTSFEVEFQVNSETGSNPAQIPATPSSSPTVLIPSVTADSPTSNLPLIAVIVVLFLIIIFVINRVLDKTNRNKQTSK